MILLSAGLESVSTRKDKTLKIIFGTQELAPKEAGAVMAMANSFCFLAIKPETFTLTEKELMEQLKIDQMTNTIKTPSQRLRGVLYILFTQNNEGFEKFDSFYIHKIEQMVEHFKSKLTP
jgi:hypothetical protein